MIRVTIIDDARIIGSVSEKSGDGILMAWAQENEKSPGHCIFSKTGEIFDILDNDNVFELLVRATLNYMDLNGVKRGFCRNELILDELAVIGFVKKDNLCEVDIEAFFKPCCRHK